MNEAETIRTKLLNQKRSNLKGSIYHWTQVTMAYNSNKIEGSHLSEAQTEEIFIEKKVSQDNVHAIRVDDVIEAVNHFRLFDYMLDSLDQPLSLDMLCRMNLLLKQGTTFSEDPDNNVGGFKKFPNEIGFINVVHTVAPENVERELTELIDRYDSSNMELEDIAEFHVRFERIHPFTDGNGRIGRILMFRQCLNNYQVPIIILDQYRDFYIRGLQEWNHDKAYLLDTLRFQQDYYTEEAKLLGVLTKDDPKTLD